MPCDVDDTLEAACTSGIGKVDDEVMLLRIIAQLTCELVDAGGGGTGGAGSVGVVDPEGVVTATPGTSYYNTANFTFWFKTSGSGSTGWQQVV